MLKIIIAASISSFFFGLFGVSWDTVDEKIENEFPAVQFISTDSLHKLYKGDNSNLPIIIDVREIEEFEVSHLPGARNLTTAASIAALIPAKETEIIVYCSVGYRSAGVAENLQNLGYTKVLNLRHSIFDWANKGYVLTGANGPANKVHPFNRAWGSLLESELQQY